jgi:hypothetical protein
VIVGLLTVFLRASLLPWIGIPEPAITDEFSYLLGADTFASGRLTNPPHPMWVHFETYNVLQQPTYASKYPPLQAVFLAMGQRLLGHPWFGVLISMGLMCGSISWMLQGWVPARWALLGGIIATGQIGVLSPWMNSYWGGAVAATGGSLVLGALPRLLKSARPQDAVVAAVGFVVMLNSRPYEGVLLSSATLAAFAFWPIPGPYQQRFTRLLQSRFILPVFLALGVSAATMCYYNCRVTGHPFSLPYFVHDQQYNFAPLFIWQEPRRMPVYRHAEMRTIWTWVADYYFQARAHPTRVPISLLIEGRNFFFKVSSILVVPIALCFYLWSVPAIRIAGLVTMLFIGGLMPLFYVMPHYLAPITGMFFLFVVEGLRLLRTLRFRTKSFGVRLPAVIVALWGISCVWSTVAYIRSPERFNPDLVFVQARRTILETLAQDRSAHLVIVHYNQPLVAEHEWVFNRANIDEAAVVWARDMGNQANQELFRYFPQRKRWLLIADDAKPILRPHPNTGE